MIAKSANEWVINNQSELMRLRLVSWYAKGFRIYENGDLSALASRLRVPHSTSLVGGLGTPVYPSLTRPTWRTSTEPWDSAIHNICFHN